MRPPVLCPGCPHRGIFYALSRLDVMVIGDIGCYSLGTFPPLSRMDTLVCMGAGASMLQGVEKAGETQNVVGILGDSTFFHSGITGLVNLVYNKSHATLIVVDNRTTAMTGHQEHPGSNRTLQDEPTYHFSIEEMAKACGVSRITVVDPYDFKACVEVLKTEMAADEVSLIISRAPCVLDMRRAVGPRRTLDQSVCKNCRMCLKLGCPAIVSVGDAKPSIDPQLCMGCALCESVCPHKAIHKD